MLSISDDTLSSPNVFIANSDEDFAYPSAGSVELGANALLNSTNLWVGQRGDGSLEITNGGIASTNQTFLGTLNNGSGTALVTGTGSQLLATSFLLIGNQGEGVLTVSEMGTVTGVDVSVGNESGAKGTVTVTGVGSSLEAQGLTIANGFQGPGAQGTLGLLSGAKTTASNSSIAVGAGSEGTVTVSGVHDTTQSQFMVSNFLGIGQAGTGTLSVSDGGTVNADGASLAFEAGSEGTVTVSGVNGAARSQFMVSNFLGIGQAGTGSLSVSDGGKVDSRDVALGLEADSQGTVTVFGVHDTTQSQLSISNFLTVGDAGSGTLTVLENGKVSTANMNIGRHSAGSKGAVVVSGADGTLSSELSIESFLGVGVEGKGTLTVSDGGTVNAVNIKVAGNSLSSATSGIISVEGMGSELNAVGTNPTGGFVADLWVGVSGTGKLNVTDGAKVTIDGKDHAGASLRAGHDVGSVGTIIVRGTNSEVNIKGDNNYVRLGDRGEGTMRVEAGSALNARALTLGQQATGVGSLTVKGEKAILTLTPDSASGAPFLTIGRGGQGSVSVLDGGEIRISGGDLPQAGLNVGRDAGEKTSTLVVDGADSKLTIESTISGLGQGGLLNIGRNGKGQVDVRGGGEIRNADNGLTTIGRETGSEGTLVISGAHSEFDAGQLMLVGMDFDFTTGKPLAAGGTGTVIIEDGGTLQSRETVIGVNGKLQGDDGHVVGNITNYGAIVPGDRLGGLKEGLDVVGDVTFGESSLFVYEVDSPALSVNSIALNVRSNSDGEGGKLALGGVVYFSIGSDLPAPPTSNGAGAFFSIVSAEDIEGFDIQSRTTLGNPLKDGNSYTVDLEGRNGELLTNFDMNLVGDQLLVPTIKLIDDPLTSSSLEVLGVTPFVNRVTIRNSNIVSGSFDRERPTLVLTHGWAPTAVPEGDFPLNAVLDQIVYRANEEFFRGDESALNDFEGFNLVDFTWDGANTELSFLGYSVAAANTFQAGVILGQTLRNELGPAPADVHLIGHSLGTAVNASATDFIQVDQFTILDAPMNVTERAAALQLFPYRAILEFDSDWFQATLNPSVGYVDNYFGDYTGLPFPAFGGVIDGAAPSGGKLYPGANHSEVHEIHYSALVGESGWTSPILKTFQSRPTPASFFPRTLKILGSAEEYNNLINWSTSGNVTDEPQVVEGIQLDGFSLIENSPASIFQDVTWASDATLFSFDFAFVDIGDGDIAQLRFDDQLLWQMTGFAGIVDELLSFTIPIAELAGQTGQLRFDLNSTGDANAHFFVTNFRVAGGVVPSSSVPEPTTTALLALGLIGAGYARRRASVNRTASFRSAL